MSNHFHDNNGWLIAGMDGHSGLQPIPIIEEMFFYSVNLMHPFVLGNKQVPTVLFNGVPSVAVQHTPKFLWPHLGVIPDPLDLLTPLHILLGNHVAWLPKVSVYIGGQQAAICAITGPVSVDLDCWDFGNLPTSIVLNEGTVETSATWADYAAGIKTALIQLAINAAMYFVGKGLGKLFEKGLDKVFDKLAEKMLEDGAEDAAEDAERSVVDDIADALEDAEGDEGEVGEEAEEAAVEPEEPTVELTPEQRLAEGRRLAKEGDFSPGDDPVLWTGKGAQEAIPEGSSPLNETEGGKALAAWDDANQDIPWEDRRPLWEEASARYADGIVDRYGLGQPLEGVPIHVYIGEENPGNIFRQVEEMTVRGGGVKLILHQV